MSLEDATRSMENLYRAWMIVRRNVLASGREHFKGEVRRISEHPLPYLRRIQTRLQRGKFAFAQQRAVLRTKSNGTKRPIVVSPIENRVVQRALLNTLQTEDVRLADGLGRIPEMCRVPTSVGGIPGRGVPEAMLLIREAIKGGATHYLRSDIRDFFTKIPRHRVVDTVRRETKDDGFADLFGAAMAVELENADEVREYIHLFPDDGIGVPQGSSLSAFAGNVILEAFDSRLNGREITTVRYIDDFVILGPSGRSVQAAFESAKRLLAELGMTAYGPRERPDKASAGEISTGFNFLGCEVRAGRIGPSRKSVSALLAELKLTLRFGERAVEELVTTGAVRRAEDAYVQILAGLDRKIRGWGDAFTFADDRKRFIDADGLISEMLAQFVDRTARIMAHATPDARRRALGVALLKETPVTEDRFAVSEGRGPALPSPSRPTISTVVLPPTTSAAWFGSSPAQRSKQSKSGFLQDREE